MSGYVTFTGLHAAPEPPACPECKGKCCRSDLGYRVEHMGAECYEHYCEACHDGTVPAPVRTAEDERADVVAYLAHARAFPFTYDKGTPAILDALRELIEQGQHEGWAKKATERGE